jgi:oxygen-independent coproporphyrinogen-3 oxidase
MTAPAASSMVGTLPVSRRDRFVFQYPPFATMRPETARDFVAQMNAGSETDEPFELYLHIPFCRVRCTFCYYNVVPNSFRTVVNPYVQSLHKEIDLLAQLPALRGRAVETVYFGGGTPTYLQDDQLRDLITHLKTAFRLAPEYEFTCEAEPTTITEGKLRLLKELGINRVSFGIQSFHPEIAQLNGRIAKPEIVQRALEWATATDFNVLNIDLMSGCLGETMETWKYSLDAALAYEPEHLTIYRMEIKPGTPLYTLLQLDPTMRKKFVGDADELAMTLHAGERLAAAGYRHDSSFAWIREPRFSQQHRQHSWHGKDLIAVGESAFGYANGYLYQNIHHHRPYSATVDGGRLAVDRAYHLSKQDRMRSYMVMGIKLLRIDRQAFRTRFGVDPSDAFGEEIAALEEAGAITMTDASIDVTSHGCLYADSFVRVFFPPEHLAMDELSIGTPSFDQWGDDIHLAGSTSSSC